MADDTEANFGSTLLTADQSSSRPEIKPLPSAEEFYLNFPLYEVLHIAKGQDDEADQLRFCTVAIDSYCPDCGEHSIFRQTNIPETYWAQRWHDLPVFEATFSCSRNSDHILHFIVKVFDGAMMKIGQYPSLASLATYDVKKYNKVLEKNYYQELTKAIGLAAHGVGVGSFVYLRRIFEGLIEKAHRASLSDVGWNEAAYGAARMDEKIQMLKSRLPDFLVEHKAMYGVLSKGVHELSEEECLRCFATIKVGIELILDDEIELRAKEHKIALAKKALTGVIAQMSK